MLRKSLAFVVVALLLAAGASAQSVGLVLSGGGAKGLYHIGVIQALEENEIPIDYVAGTHSRTCPESTIARISSGE